MAIRPHAGLPPPGRSGSRWTWGPLTTSPRQRLCPMPAAPTSTAWRSRSMARVTRRWSTRPPPPSPTWTNAPAFPAAPHSGTGCSSPNTANNRPATAWSVTGPNPAALAADGFSGTRWESAQGVDPQWIQLDFGSTATFCSVVLHWEVAAAKSFQIQTSPDAATWTPIYSTTTGTGGDQILTVSGSGQVAI